MNIRRAVNNDIPSLNKLLFQVLDVHHTGRPDIFKDNAKKYTDDELLEIIKDDTKPIFVAEDENGKVVGYAFCVYIQHTSNNILTNIKTLYIDDLCVDESARGKHIGTLLYNYVVNFAKENGFYNVTLNVWGLNEVAIKFYEKQGLTVQKIGMEKIL